MPRVFILLLVCWLLPKGAAAQFSPGTPHLDELFDDVQVQKNLSYQQPQAGKAPAKRQLFDWYQGKGDTARQRPLVILMHGGGFKLGHKSSDSTPFIAEAFARNGFACASINYRLSKKRPLAKFGDLAEGCFDALEDLDSAIRFFRENWRAFRIDTSAIILAGNSAGGMMALHGTYCSRYELGSFTGRADSLTLDRTVNPHQVAAIVNFWGAIYDTSWLANCRVPMVNIHGDKDRLVPWNDPRGPLFGTGIIHRVADSLGIPNLSVVYKGYDHELHKRFNPLWPAKNARPRWADAVSQASRFIHQQLRGPGRP